MPPSGGNTPTDAQSDSVRVIQRMLVGIVGVPTATASHASDHPTTGPMTSNPSPVRTTTDGLRQLPSAAPRA